MNKPLNRAEARRLFGDMTTDIPKPGTPALELESHICGIVTRHASMLFTSSNAQGIVTAQDHDGRLFKIEISQVAGPA